MYPAVAYASLEDIVLLDTIKLKMQHPKVVNMAVDAYCQYSCLLDNLQWFIQWLILVLAHMLIIATGQVYLIYFSFATPASFFAFFISNRPLSSDLIGFFVNNLVEDQL